MKRIRTTLHGFTLIEVLIALAVISIAFAALSFIQITNLRASSSSRLTTETKNAANGVLEQVLAEVLFNEPCVPDATRPWCEDEDASTGTFFAFNDFYWTCPSVETPSPGSLLVRTDRLAEGECTGSRAVTSGSGHVVDVGFSIAGQAGIAGEGVLAISVTAIHSLRDNVTVTIGDRVTCYDVYPTPTAEAPAPCPIPTAVGAGRGPS